MLINLPKCIKFISIIHKTKMVYNRYFVKIKIAGKGPIITILLNKKKKSFCHKRLLSPLILLKIKQFPSAFILVF